MEIRSSVSSPSVVELLYHMRHETKVPFNEDVAGTFVSCFFFDEQLPFLFRPQRLGNALPLVMNPVKNPMPSKAASPVR